jgi:hypothetical protein
MQVTKTEVNGGYRMVIEFENGFGLSVVEHQFSYGLEAGLLKQGYEGLVYDGKKFIDVIGYLTTIELVELIAWTSALPADYQVSENPLSFEDDDII